MSSQAKLSIRRNIVRPDPAKLEQLRTAPTGWLVDAQGRRGALPHWIRPLTHEKRFAGSALTVSTRPIDNLAPYAALKYARPGDVLVVAADGDENASVMGDILIGMARNAGVVGIVTDGMVRDIKGIDEVGIPVFARALTPNSPFKDGPGKIGFPVAIGNITIGPGDVLVGDEDGAVAIPGDSLEGVLASLSSIAAKEAAMEQAVTEGAAYPDWLDDILASDQVVFTD